MKTHSTIAVNINEGGDFECIVEHVDRIIDYIECGDYDAARTEAHFIFEDIPAKYKP